MHIPDGFLSTPVWAALDVVAIPAVTVLARRAANGMEESRAPLLGIMGAFVFAAQMINFPVGLGTSGHLVGAALLAIALGPAAATVVMTAILAVQSFVFQDGGILALGANVLNMAVVGTLAGYAPYHALSRTGYRTVGIALGGFLSVAAGAAMAIVELLLSGIPMHGAVLSTSLIVFAAAGVAEAVITVAIVRALERMHPRFVRAPEGSRSRALALAGAGVAVLAAVGIVIASAAPDGLEKLAEEAGFAARVQTLAPALMPDYQIPGGGPEWMRKVIAALAGLGLMLFVSFGVARLLWRRKAGAGGGA